MSSHYSFLHPSFSHRLTELCKRLSRPTLLSACTIRSFLLAAVDLDIRKHVSQFVAPSCANSVATLARLSWHEQTNKRRPSSPFHSQLPTRPAPKITFRFSTVGRALHSHSFVSPPGASSPFHSLSTTVIFPHFTLAQPIRSGLKSKQAVSIEAQVVTSKRLLIAGSKEEKRFVGAFTTPLQH